jgi:hypothetical protein
MDTIVHIFAAYGKTLEQELTSWHISVDTHPFFSISQARSKVVGKAKHIKYTLDRRAVTEYVSYVLLWVITEVTYRVYNIIEAE